MAEHKITPGSVPIAGRLVKVDEYLEPLASTEEVDEMTREFRRRPTTADVLLEIAEMVDSDGWATLWGDYLKDAAAEIERLQSIVDWMINERLDDFDDDPNYGPGLAYDGVIWDRPGSLPYEVVLEFRKARAKSKRQI